MIYVEHAQSNIKGGVDVRLHPRTLIVGPNGAGKDAILQTVTLALQGVAYDVAGKDRSSGGEAFELATPGSTELTATVRLSDQSEHTWSMQAKRGGGYTSPSGGYPGRVFTLRDVQAQLFDVGAAAARENLLSLVGRFDDGAVLEWLTPRLRPVYDEVKAIVGDGGTAPERLRGAIKAAQRLQRSATAEAKGAHALVERVAAAAASLPTDAQVAELEAEIAQLTGQAQAAGDADAHRRACENAERMRESAQQGSAEAAQRITSINAEAAALMAEQEEVNNWLQAYPPQVGADLVQALATVVERQAAMASAGEPSCTVCGSHVDAQALAHRASDLEGAAQGMLARAAHRAQQEARAEAVKARLATLEREYHTQVEIYNAGQVGIQQWTKELDRLRGAAQAEGGEQASAQAKLREAQARLSTMQQARGQAQTLTESRREAARQEEAASNYKKLSEVLREAGAALLQRSIDAFCAGTSAYLPGDAKLAVVLKDGRSATCRFGLTDGVSVKTALSGAELNMVLYAMTAYFAQTWDGLALFIAPERAYDSRMLHSIMAAMADANGQVILVTPEYAGVLPGGFVRVDVGGSTPPSGPAPEPEPEPDPAQSGTAADQKSAPDAQITGAVQTLSAVQTAAATLRTQVDARGPIRESEAKALVRDAVKTWKSVSAKRWAETLQELEGQLVVVDGYLSPAGTPTATGPVATETAAATEAASDATHGGDGLPAWAQAQLAEEPVWTGDHADFASAFVHYYGTRAVPTETVPSGDGGSWNLYSNGAVIRGLRGGRILFYAHEATVRRDG